MATETLANLKLQVREQADMVNSTFISEDELKRFINLSASRLHDILIEKHGADYFVNEYTFSTVNGTEDYALPTDFYKMRGVDVEINGNEPYSIRPFNFAERNYWKYPGPRWPYDYRYRIVGNNIRLTPVPSQQSTLKLFYHPVYTKLNVNPDTLQGFNGYERWIILDSAIKCRIKEESDVTELLNERAFVELQIESAADNRDAGEPPTISDVEPRLQRRYFPWP